jgi:hypothetical protein
MVMAGHAAEVLAHTQLSPGGVLGYVMVNCTLPPAVLPSYKLKFAPLQFRETVATFCYKTGRTGASN